MKLKLRKNQMIFMGIITSFVMAISISVPIIVINRNEKKAQNKKDVHKVYDLLITKEKTITLPSDSNGKIIKDNKSKIINKIYTLISEISLNGVKIDISMKTDTDISTTSNAITITLTKEDHQVIIREDSSTTNKIFKVKKDT